MPTRRSSPIQWLVLRCRPAVVAIVVSIVAGTIMALPALRLSAWYFALITLGFAEVTEQMLVQWVPLTHGFGGLIGVPMPSFGGPQLGPREFLWLVLVIDLLAFLLVRNIIRSRLGRSLIAVREGGTAAVASGISVVRAKLFAFMVSAGLAGLAGALLAAQQTVITPDIFTVDFSVFFLVAVVLGGAGRLWGPVVGCIAFFALPELLTALGTWRLAVYGIVLIVLMVFAPSGIAGAVAQLAGRLKSALPTRVAERLSVGAAPSAPNAWVHGGSAGAEMTMENLRMTFGGVVAVDDVSLRVAAGTVQAVVGPNGSGKTTLLNLISGYYRPVSGLVRIGERNVVGSSPPAIARMGLGRTFQTPRLLPDLSLLENVLLGAYPRERSTGLEVALRLPRARKEARLIREEALASLDFVGLADHAALPAGEVPHGQQRLAEIARSLVGQPQVLLLDEPAAGLSLRELDLLSELIREIRRRDITVILVEHHIDLITEICDRVLVLNRGAVLTEGVPADVFAHPEVIAAYTGGVPE